MDLAYILTGISGVLFWVSNFENLYFFGGVLVKAAAFFLVCQINAIFLKGFMFNDNF